MMRGYGYSNGYGMMGGYSPFAGLLIFIFWLLILAGVVLLVIWVVRQMSHGGHMMQSHPGTAPPGAQQQQDEAMAIARKRLASGEITKEQFEEIRQALGG